MSPRREKSKGRRKGIISIFAGLLKLQDPRVTTPRPVKNTWKDSVWHPLKIPFIHPKKDFLCIVSLSRNNTSIVSRSRIKKTTGFLYETGL